MYVASEDDVTVWILSLLESSSRLFTCQVTSKLGVKGPVVSPNATFISCLGRIQTEAARAPQVEDVAVCAN